MDVITYALCMKKIKDIIGDAPEALDTLQEIAKWIEANNKQVDWNQLDPKAVDFIKNKPDIKKQIEEIIANNLPKPDWDINDETNPGFIKNRPFYTTDPTEIEILPQADYDFFDMGAGGMYAWPDSQSILNPLFEAPKAIISWDSAEYICEKKTGTFLGESVLYFGNSFLSDSSSLNTNEPFIIVYYSPEQNFIITHSTNPSHSVQVKGIKPKDIQIHPKYLKNKPGTIVPNGGEIFNNNFNVASGELSHAEGDGTAASGASSHAEGHYTSASGYSSHAEGFSTRASANNSHAEGSSTKASGESSHAEGSTTTASYPGAHAEGSQTIASGHDCHAEGYNTKASSRTASHAEGNYTEAYGDYSHSEGDHTKAIGQSSHTEGSYTEAPDTNSHAEGDHTKSYGRNSHTEGKYTKTRGDNSHSEGQYTIASGNNSHVEGQYNIIDTDNGIETGTPNNKYVHIVGNGSSKWDTVDGKWQEVITRSNAHTLDWRGNAWYQGSIKVGGTGWDDLTAKEIKPLEQASTTSLGGIKADPITATDTIEVKINTTTGKLYVSPSEILATMTSAEEVQV